MNVTPYRAIFAYIVLWNFSLSIVPAWTFSGIGQGTETSPYVIADVTQLQEMNLAPEAHYCLRNNIDASETEEWNGGTGFEPIGNFENPFQGVFDGAGYAISGLFIERATRVHVGLFGVIKDSTLQNVLLVECDVRGGEIVGGLVGLCAFLNLIDNCNVSGSISGVSNIGGIAGWALDTTISRCRSTSQVQGSYYNIGGIVGWTSNQSLVIDSHADCDVSGPIQVGGLIGLNANVFLRDDSNAVRCSSAGKVVATDYGAGGIAGRNAYGAILNCYSACSIFGATAAGGLVGENLGYLENSYSIGPVSGEINVGGFVGHVGNGSSTSCYWDTETSGLVASAAGTGKTTAEMFQPSTFEGWDFTSVWRIDEGFHYPRLSWERGEAWELLRMIERFREGRASGEAFFDSALFWKSNP